MPDTIELGPIVTPDGSIQMDYGPVNNINDSAATSRAQKYHYILGDDSPGEDSLAHTILSGREGSLREYEATKKNIEDEQIRLGMIQRAGEQFGGTLNNEQFDYLHTLTSTQLRNPDSIFETEYAKKLFSDLHDTQEDTPIEQARAEEPAQAYFLEDFAQGKLANLEILRKQEEDLNLQKSQKSLLGRIGDYVENLIPGTTWYHLQNSLVKLPNAPFLLGNNLAEGVQWANSLPPDEYARVVPQAIQAVAAVNLNDAQTLVEALRSHALSDQGAGNLQSLLDLSTVLDIGAGVGKGLIKSAPEAAGEILGKEALDETKQIGQTRLLAGPKAPPVPDKVIEQKMPFVTRRPRNRNAAFGQTGKQYIGTKRVRGPENFIEPGTRVGVNDNTPQAGLNGYRPQKTWQTDPAEAEARPAVKSSVGDAGEVFDDTVKEAGSQAKPDIPELLSTAGKTDEAVLEQTLKETSRDKNAVIGDVLDAAEINAQREDFIKNVPSFSNPLGSGDFQLSRDVFARVKEIVTGNLEKLLTGLSDIPSLERLSIEQQAQAIQLAQMQVKREYPSTSNALHAIDWLSGEFNPENVHRVQLTFKRPDGAVFKTPQKAKYFAEQEAKFKENYYIRPQGGGYVVQLVRNVDETNPMIRNVMIETKNTTPSGFGKGGIAGNIRTANDLLSQGQNAVRKVLVHGIQKPGDLLYDVSEPIRALSGQSRKNFIRFTEAMRDYVSPRYKRGISFQTQGDFETAWQGSFGRLPTDKETAAYWTYQSLNDWDYISRNLLLYRMKARKGFEGITVSWGDKKIPFEGKVASNEVKVSDLDKNTGVLFLDKASKQKAFFYAGEAKAEDKRALQEMIDNNGYQLVQLFEPYARPLADATEEGRVVNFVVTKDYRRDGLSFNQIEYNPGGHVVYDHDHWIKQPKFVQLGKRRVYVGDVTIRPMNTQSLSKEMAQKYEHARILFKAQKYTELTKYLQDNLYEDFNEFAEYFNSGRLDVNTPITSISGQEKTVSNPLFRNTLGDFEDARNDPYNAAANVGLEFLGDRNLDIEAISSKGIGTNGNPLLALTTPRMVDPLMTIERAAGNLANSMFLEDYRTLSSENFIREFSDVLRRDVDKLEINPVAVLMDKNPFRADADPLRVAAARNYQNRVQDLLRVRSDTQRQLDAIKEKLYDSVYNNFGENAADTLDEKFLSKEINPVYFFRKVAFATKLGLFMPLQYFKQAQTLGLVLAMGEKNAALKSFPVYPLVQSLRLSNGSQAMLDHAAKIASSFGWKPEDFKEWFSFYWKSGLNDIKGEHAFKDGLNDPKLFKGVSGRFLDKHTIFFDEGERTHRIVGSATAYQEWKAKNPFKTLDRRAWEGIMLRQDDLTQNMTKASNAAWQKGIWTIPTQFASYQIRFWEQMMGRRLSWQEKAKMIGVQSMLYGVPVTVSGLSIYPFYEDIRRGRLERGSKTEIDTPWDVAVQAFHNGLVSATAQLLTGEEYDVGSAYGATGLSLLKDAFTGKKSMAEILAGAAGGSFNDIVKTTYPVITDAVDMIRNGAGKGSRQIVMSDLEDFAKNVSTVNYAYKVFYAGALGKYITKNGIIVKNDMTSWDTLMSAFGVNPQGVGDTFLMLESGSIQKEAQMEAKKGYSKWMNKYWEAQRKGESKDITDAYYKKAQTWLAAGDFNPGQMNEVLSFAAKGNEALLDAVNQKFLLENSPESQSEDRFNEFMRQE